MMEIVLFIIIFLGILINGVWSFRSENEKPHSWLFIVLAVIAIIALIAQSAINRNDSKDAQIKHDELVTQNGTLNEDIKSLNKKIESLDGQNKSLLTNNELISEQNKSLLTQNESLHGQNEVLHDKIAYITDENLKLRDSIMQPVLEYYEDGFRQTEDKENGRFISYYEYRSKRASVAIRDIKIVLEFDKPIMRSSFSIVQSQGAMRNVKKYGTVEYANRTNKVTFLLPELPPDFKLNITVFSKDPLEIVSNNFTPKAQ